MRTLFAVLLSALAAGAAARAVPADDYPQWAYGFAAPGDPATISSPFAAVVAADSGSLRSAPGSPEADARADPRRLRARGLVRGRTSVDAGDRRARQEAQHPRVFALPLSERQGPSENSAVSGLPYAYFLQTMADFKSGVRKSADPRKTNTKSMASFAQLMSDDEIKASAEYFSSITWTRGSRSSRLRWRRRRASSADVHGARRQREGADRRSDHRGAGEHRSHRGAARFALRLHRTRRQAA